MRVLVIGASGTIGRAVADALAERHEVLRASRSAALSVDLGDPGSIARLYAAVGRVDAVVSAAGQAVFKPLAMLTDADFALSLSNKLMGQVNVVRLGLDQVTDGGSFTLTSGILSRFPAPGGSAISIVNAGVEAFGRAAALELPRGLRLNVVSPGWVSETLARMKRDPSGGVPAATLARAYVDMVEGRATGQVIDVARTG